MQDVEFFDVEVVEELHAGFGVVARVGRVDGRVLIEENVGKGCDNSLVIWSALPLLPLLVNNVWTN